MSCWVKSSVYEVDATTWAMDTLYYAADMPIDIFTKHGGLPLKDRPPWWASLGESIESARGILTNNVSAVLEHGIGTRWGQDLETGSSGFRGHSKTGRAIKTPVSTFRGQAQKNTLKG